MITLVLCSSSAITLNYLSTTLHKSQRTTGCWQPNSLELLEIQGGFRIYRIELSSAISLKAYQLDEWPSQIRGLLQHIFILPYVERSCN
jgi:hypothetical protein